MQYQANEIVFVKSFMSFGKACTWGEIIQDGHTFSLRGLGAYNLSKIDAIELQLNYLKR